MHHARRALSTIFVFVRKKKVTGGMANCEGCDRLLSTFSFSAHLAPTFDVFKTFNLNLLPLLYLMVCHSPFDDDIMHSDPVTYGIQPPASPERCGS